jgi:DNA-binding CsgD family transcriptional regulator/GAF domain-containing protein
MQDKGHMTRETQVMILASEGFTDKQIASYLGISSDTVSTYWRRILARFGAASRTEVIAKMVQQQASEAIAKATAENKELRDEIEQKSIVEQQLAKTTERLNLLMDGIATGVLFLTEDLLLLYANKSFGEMFSLSDRPENLVGTGNQVLDALMRSVVQDFTKVEARTLQIIEQGEPVKDERIQLTNGRIIERSYQQIMVDDTSYGHLFLHRDITEVAKANENIKFQSDFARLLSSVTPVFISAAGREVSSAIDHALEKVGHVAEVDRAYFFQFCFNAQELSCTNEWCAKGISEEKQNLQNLPMSVFPWWMNQIMEGQAIVVNDIADLGDEAKGERDSFREQGIQSAIVVPVLGSQGDALGFLGFDSVRVKRTWNDHMIEMLAPLSSMISALLERGQCSENCVIHPLIEQK